MRKLLLIFFAALSATSAADDYCSDPQGLGCTYIYQDRYGNTKGVLNDEDVDMRATRKGVSGTVGNSYYEYESDTGIMHYDTPSSSGTCIQDEYGLYCY